MRKPDAKKWNPKQLIPIAIFLIVGFAGGFCIGLLLNDLNDIYRGLPFPLPLVITMVYVLIAIYAQLILHEAGHLVCGLISGYRFSSFRVGSLMLFKDGNRLKLKTLSIAGTGGQCLMLPPQSEDGRAPFQLYFLGGALANFVTSAVFALLYFFISRASLLSPLLSALAIIGLTIGLMNAIPLRLAMLDNDGNTLRSLKKDPQAVLAFFQMMQIHGRIAAGDRLKDMPEGWFQTPVSADTTNTLIATIEVYRCNRLLDEQRFADTAQSIRALFASNAAIAGIHRGLLVCDLAYCALMMDQESEVIALLDAQQLKFMKSMKRFPSVLRTQYAVAILRDQDAEQAASIQTAFDRMAVRYPYASDIASEQELMCAALKKSIEP